MSLPQRFKTCFLSDLAMSVSPSNSQSNVANLHLSAQIPTIMQNLSPNWTKALACLRWSTIEPTELIALTYLATVEHITPLLRRLENAENSSNRLEICRSDLLDHYPIAWKETHWSIRECRKWHRWMTYWIQIWSIIHRLMGCLWTIASHH